MKTRCTNVLMVLTAMLFSFGTLNAQTVFWSEDFAGGIPADWTNVDASANAMAVWTYCATPTDNGINGCSGWWDDNLNLQVPFASATSTNGFVTVDSDANGYNEHVSELTTSAIDLSGQSAVVLRMETHIGVFTVAAETGAIARVSNDGGTTWDSYTIFPGLLTGPPDPGVARWSLNPHVAELDISATAANQSAVLIQWQWTGNYEYLWNLDDIKLQDMITPLPDNDMVSVDMNPAEYYSTPISQVSLVDFGGIVANSGALDQTNVTLTATVTDVATSMVVATDQATEATLAAGDSVLIDPAVDWTPPAAVGAYTLDYTVSADASDDVPINNDFSFPFIVTPGTFAKAEVPTLSVSAGEPMEFGNLYTVVNNTTSTGDPIIAESITTGFTNANNVDGQTITVYLMKVLVDIFDPNIQTFDDSSIDIVGVGFYEAPVGTGPDSGEQTIALVDDVDFASPVMLEANTTYLAMYSDTDAAGDNRAYSAGTIDYPFGFGSLVRTGGAIGGGGGTWFLGGFGSGSIAYVNLNITPVGTVGITQVPELADDQVSIFPNPASELVTVDLELTNISETVEVKIIDATGRIIMNEKHDDLKQGTFTYNVAQFATGTYFMNIITDEGNKTNRFTVAH